MRAKVIDAPEDYVAQRLVGLSTHPTEIDGVLAPRHVDLRPYVLMTAPDDISVLPGGMTRVALDEGALVVNSSQNGGAKDTWVLREAAAGLGALESGGRRVALDARARGGGHAPRPARLGARVADRRRPADAVAPSRRARGGRDARLGARALHRPARHRRRRGGRARRPARRARRTNLEALGLRAAVAGTHPFAQWSDIEVSPGARYQSIYDSMRELARREPTFALHVHVAVPDAEMAVRALRGMRVHVPLLLALAANSPFWQGRDTGLAAARVPIFGTFPRVGIPRPFDDYADYVEAIDVLLRCGAFPEPTFLWWDVRLQPKLGTLEVRIMDAQTRAADNAALAALVQCLVRLEATEGYADARDRLPGPRCSTRTASSPRATGRGPSSSTRSATAGARCARSSTSCSRRCAPHAAVLGCEAELALVPGLAAEPGDHRQRLIAGVRQGDAVGPALGAARERARRRLQRADARGARLDAAPPGAAARASAGSSGAMKASSASRASVASSGAGARGRVARRVQERARADGPELARRQQAADRRGAAARGGVDRRRQVGVGRRRDVERARSAGRARASRRARPAAVATMRQSAGAVRSPSGSVTGYAGEERGEVAERAVELRAVELVDDEPAVAVGRGGDDPRLPLVVARAAERVARPTSGGWR